MNFLAVVKTMGSPAQLTGHLQKTPAYARASRPHVRGVEFSTARFRGSIYRTTQRADADSWLVKLTTRRNKRVATVAMANKTARTVRALLAHRQEFKAGYAAV
ncbi:hypothetical protein [Paucibacter sp. M5-1]|uniref:hypothetical protein n=1 Tax=Paucibacter sp. M5-1 TaxID=3015998 RepID=UPI003F7D59B5